MNTYTLINTPPSVEAYMHLREAAGLSPKSLQAATLGLAGTWYGVHIRNSTDTIAMGRIIGDGGCFFSSGGYCRTPSLSRARIGHTNHGRPDGPSASVAPPTALVSLLADGEAPRLYQKFGFTLSAPASVGMIRRF